MFQSAVLISIEHKSLRTALRKDFTFVLPYILIDFFFTRVLISPLPDLLPDVFCLMVRIFRLMLVLFYIYK